MENQNAKNQKKQISTNHNNENTMDQLGEIITETAENISDSISRVLNLVNEKKPSNHNEG
ncbi:hypothetical protein [Neobacillus terrae]|uniref:hypothetical protein n=1 Tax=Neobacillus terrae TaxID=3034837 RepID=UPI00140CAA61|nr:hypothetical protein [Neobacillus terrae]NHM32114.1 hypothetical protein [Neobacillus terrae]